MEKQEKNYQESNISALLDVLSPEDDAYTYIKVVHEGMEDIKFHTSDKIKEVIDNVHTAYAHLSQEEKYALDDKYGSALGDMMYKLEDLIWNEDPANNVNELLSEYNPEIWRDSIASPAGSASFKAYRTQKATLKEKGIQNATAPRKAYENKAEMDNIMSLLTGDWYQPQQDKEIMPAPRLPQVEPKQQPSVKKRSWSQNKVFKLAAVTTLSFTGTVAALFGYSALKNVDNPPYVDFHGAAIVEAIAPQAQVKNSPLLGNVTLDEVVIEIDAPQKNVMKMPQKVMQIQEEPYEDYHVPHKVKKGDTIVKMWKGYYDNGGALSFVEYLKEVQKRNPRLKNPDKIYAGNVLEVPSLD